MMIYKVKLFITLFTILSCLSGCSSNSVHTIHDTTIIDYKLIKGKPLPPKEWHCYNVNEEKICIPESWGYVKQDKYLFVSDISRMSPGAYFTVVKYNMKESAFTPTKYLSQLYWDLKKDTIGRLTGYQTSKITYADKETFSSEFYTLINNVPYITYSTIFERDGNLFEIALKIEQSKARSFHESYSNIVFNFYHKDKLVFSFKDKMTGFESLDLTKI